MHTFDTDSLCSTNAQRPCPIVFTVGLVFHGLGAVGFAVAFYLGFVVWNDEGGDPLWIGIAMSAPLLALAFTCAVAWHLRARRRLAGGLALARSVLALLTLGILAMALLPLAFVPPLLLPWLPAALGEVLLLLGGIIAFVRSLSRAGDGARSTG